MHVEPPEGRLATLKDFAKHYAMIVVSILTALALEQALEAWHHREAAEQSAHEVEAELRDSLSQVKDAMQANAAREKALDAVATKLEAAILAGTPADRMRAEIIRPFTKDPAHGLGFAFPTLPREAWERAIANQSAAWIAPARLGKFSSAYTAEREIPPLAYQGMSMLMDGHSLIDAMVDAKLDRVDPVQYLKVLRHYESALGTVQSNLDELRKAIGDAVAGGEAPAASAH